MRQVLFHIPIIDLPIYGYGLMLFIAYLSCSALGRRLCRWQGINDKVIPDLIIWLFVAGIAGGRIVFVTQYWHADAPHGFDKRPWLDVIKLWDGGLVLYGALIGGALGYFGYWYFVLKRQGVSNWKMLDVVAPCLALGVALGRIGCLCTGCCYGDIACTSFPPPLHFPYHSAAWGKMVQLGYQSPLGFILADRSAEIEAVEPGSAAAAADLRPGDIIEKVDGRPVLRQGDIVPTDGELHLTILRGNDHLDITFAPTSVGVNPTQIYETISMSLLLFFLVSYFPFRRRDGELMVLFMLLYAIHRFLNESLRNDTDPVLFGLTLSQNISIGVFLAGLVLAYFVWRRPTIGAAQPVPETALPASAPTLS
jgi:phosphatidylglycerol:prolipoprotein diacylglycerol transferase